MALRENLGNEKRLRERKKRQEMREYGLHWKKEKM
jgi:hypothetical protein